MRTESTIGICNMNYKSGSAIVATTGTGNEQDVDSAIVAIQHEQQGEPTVLFTCRAFTGVTRDLPRSAGVYEDYRSATGTPEEEDDALPE
jgi:hypothetical protein